MVIFCYYAHVKIVGQRLYEARMLRSMTQHQLGADTGNTRELISMVEHGRTGLSVANLSAAAPALGVSTDFLCGLSSDPTPADQLADLAASRDLDDQDARAGTADDGDYIGVSEFATAAGGGAVVDDERVTGRIKFRRTWLARHGLVAPQCRVIQVLGESMEPTLLDSYSIMVNRDQTRRRVGVSTSCGREGSGSEACGQGRGAPVGSWRAIIPPGSIFPGPVTPRCWAR